MFSSLINSRQRASSLSERSAPSPVLPPELIPSIPAPRRNRTSRRKAPSSIYKGVSKVKDGRKKCWRGTLTYEKQQHHLGAFFTEREAAEAYNKAAKEYFGEFAHLNEFDNDDV